MYYALVKFDWDNLGTRLCDCIISKNLKFEAMILPNCLNCTIWGLLSQIVPVLRIKEGKKFSDE